MDMSVYICTWGATPQAQARSPALALISLGGMRAHPEGKDGTNS